MRADIGPIKSVGLVRNWSMRWNGALQWHRRSSEGKKEAILVYVATSFLVNNLFEEVAQATSTTWPHCERWSTRVLKHFNPGHHIKIPL